MGRILFGLTASAALLNTVWGSACQTVTLQKNTPTSGNVVMQSYSYCGGTLNATVYIANLAYNKVVTLYYMDGQGKSTPLDSIGLGYSNSISGTNYEIWDTSTPIYLNGIRQLLNVTYDVTDLNEVYVQTLNRQVIATGAPAPKLSSPPSPYITPRGWGGDINNFLSNSANSELRRAYSGLFANVNPAIEGAAPGVVVAGQSGPSFPSTDPNYEYNWVRDSSLTMDVVQMLYTAATKGKPKKQYENTLFQYATARATEQTDPNLLTGLGEPKFYLNNTIFSGPWGRPQNDGPATSSITLMEFATSYLAQGGNVSTVQQKIYDSTNYPMVAPVQKDLLFVASNWSSPSFDLWEEEESDHFYTRMVQRRALVMGVKFAKTMGDSSTASTLQSSLNALTATMSQFWSPGRQILLYEYGPVLHGKYSYLDASVPLGLIHGYAGDGLYSYTNDKVQSTILRLATSFIDVYPIFNSTVKNASGKPLGIPIGRYPEDVYNGTGTETNGGNPWYLTTAAVAQYFYTASLEYANSGVVKPTTISQPFFDYFAPEARMKAGMTYTTKTRQFQVLIDALNGWGDAFMRTIMYNTPSNGDLTEEFNRNTGVPQGCPDLTWSYASILTAAFSRAQTRYQNSYVKSLANLGFVNNE